MKSEQWIWDKYKHIGEVYKKLLEKDMLKGRDLGNYEGQLFILGWILGDKE